MTDIDALNRKIDESGLKAKFIYEKLGISKASWYKKKNGESPLTVGEIQVLCEILGITSLREKEHIFFRNV